MKPDIDSFIRTRELLPDWAIKLCILNPQEGARAFSGAIRTNNSLLLQQLLKRGVDPKAFLPFGSHPMYVAAACQNKEAIQSLLDYGVDIEQRTTTGVRPLFTALCSEADDYDETGVYDPDIELCSDFMIKHGAQLERCGNEIESLRERARSMGHPKYSQTTS